MMLLCGSPCLKKKKKIVPACDLESLLNENQLAGYGATDGSDRTLIRTLKTESMELSRNDGSMLIRHICSEIKNSCQAPR